MLELNGRPLGLINCMNFGHPEESMGEFVRILEDFNGKCKEFDIPIVGGNVSLYNATENISIKPIDYYYTNSIARASKVMSECRQISKKFLFTGIEKAS